MSRSSIIHWLLFICLILSAIVFAEDDVSPVSSITIDELHDHLFYLASDDLQGRFPGTEGYEKAVQYSIADFQSSGLKKILKDSEGNFTYLQPFDVPRRNRSIRTANIVGYIEGTDPNLKNEYVSFGVHLDHLGVRNGIIYNGADDNAASCSVLLEVAEAVVLAPTRRSVIFILYSAEELGILGSKYFVENSPVPLEKIIVNLNMEMIGRCDPQLPEGFAFIGSNKLSMELREIIKETNAKSLNLPLDFSLDEVDRMGYFNRSDSYRFHQVGIPVAYFGGSMHKDYHTPEDDAEKINLDKVHKAALLSYELVMALGNRNHRPHLDAESSEEK